MYERIDGFVRVFVDITSRQPELHSLKLKWGHPKRNFIFQPFIFTGYVSLEGKLVFWSCPPNENVSLTARFCDLWLVNLPTA